MKIFGFHTIKAILALLGADWDCQTLAQAMHKNRCWRHRLRHVAIVAGVQGVSAATADTTWSRWALFVAINAITHFAIDSVRMPKWLDQILHLIVAIVTAPLLRSAKKGRWVR